MLTKQFVLSSVPSMKTEFNKTLWTSIFLDNINKLSKEDIDLLMSAIGKVKMNQQQLEITPPSLSGVERAAEVLNKIASLTDLIHNCAQFHILENERNNAVLQ